MTALVSGMTDADESLYQNALKAHRSGKIQAAQKTYAQLLLKYPANGALLHMHGVVELQNKNLDKAVDFFTQATALCPNEQNYHNNLGVALLDLGRLDDAISAFEKVLEIDPDYIDASFNLGNVALNNKDLKRAEALFLQVLKQNPDHVGALNNLGRLLKESKRREQALRPLKRAVALQPNDIKALQNLIDCLENLSLLDEADGVCEQLLKLHPNDAMGLLLKSKLLRRSGDVKASIELLEKLERAAIHPEIKTRVRYAMGQGYDLDGCSELAFKAFLKGNRDVIERSGVTGIENNIFYQVVKREHQWFTAEKLSRLAVHKPKNNRPSPAFMVGFPRSGTTLFERMLDAHPHVVTTGEKSPLAHVKQMMEKESDYPDILNSASPEIFDGWRDAFYSFAETEIGDAINDRLLVDKMPLNIVDLGLIQSLFPDARVIVSIRDPRDVCLSCFMQNFDANAAMINFTSLASTVELYSAVMNLWLHYKQYSKLHLMDYKYEDLIANYESVVRRSTQFLELPWDDAILDYRGKAIGRDISTPSYEDVVEPLYKRAHGRWQRYLGPLQNDLGKLEPFVKAFGY